MHNTLKRAAVRRTLGRNVTDFVPLVRAFSAGKVRGKLSPLGYASMCQHRQDIRRTVRDAIQCLTGDHVCASSPIFAHPNAYTTSGSRYDR